VISAPRKGKMRWALPSGVVGPLWSIGLLLLAQLITPLIRVMKKKILKPSRFTHPKNEPNGWFSNIPRRPSRKQSMKPTALPCTLIASSVQSEVLVLLPLGLVLVHLSPQEGACDRDQVGKLGVDGDPSQPPLQPNQRHL
jgi:hypothetical protein